MTAGQMTFCRTRTLHNPESLERRGAPSAGRRGAARGAIAIIAAAAVWLGSAPAEGTTIYFQDETLPPLHGYFVTQRADSVVLRLASGELREVPRNEILRLLRPIDQERLATLTPERPKEYREYAEDLAQKKADPEARDAAIRLFLIAAHLAPDQLGRSCLLAMSGLARSAEEQRRFVALAFLLDPQHDTRPLNQESMIGGSLEQSPELRRLARQALRDLRNRKRSAARPLLEAPSVRSVLGQFESILSRAELEASAAVTCPDCERGRQPCRICQGSKLIQGRPCPSCAVRGSARGTVVCERCLGDFRNPALPPPTLKSVLAVELALLGDGEGAASKPAGGGNLEGWSLQAMQEPSLKSLSLLSATEFDPRDSVFRNGAWQRPASADQAPS